MNIVQKLAEARGIDEQAIFLRVYGRDGMYRYEHYAASGIVPEEVRSHCLAELSYLEKA